MSHRPHTFLFYIILCCMFELSVSAEAQCFLSLVGRSIGENRRWYVFCVCLDYINVIFHLSKLDTTLKNHLFEDMFSGPPCDMPRRRVVLVGDDVESLIAHSMRSLDYCPVETGFGCISLYH